MTSFNIKLDKKKVIPSLFYLAKLIVAAIITHFLLLPLIFETFTFFGELRSFWQSIMTVVLAAYLSDVIKFKIKGREWF